MASTFAEIKKVLDQMMVDWTAGNGGPPNFASHGNHRTPFLSDTAANVLAFSAQSIPMIQPGMRKIANIVLALTVNAPNPLGGCFAQMADGGLDSSSGVYLAAASQQIQTIIPWIEAGCLHGEKAPLFGL